MNMADLALRPPYGAYSFLLQVTLDCSRNKCTFCYIYPDVKLAV